MVERLLAVVDPNVKETEEEEVGWSIATLYRERLSSLSSLSFIRRFVLVGVSFMDITT